MTMTMMPIVVDVAGGHFSYSSYYPQPSYWQQSTMQFEQRQRISLLHSQWVCQIPQLDHLGTVYRSRTNNSE